MLGLQDKHGKRDKFTLMMEILNNATEPIKKTHLLYKTGINFHQLDRYLNLLTSLELINTIAEPFNGYLITQKGRQFLGLFESNKTVPEGSVIESLIPK